MHGGSEARQTTFPRQLIALEIYSDCVLLYEVDSVHRARVYHVKIEPFEAANSTFEVRLQDRAEVQSAGYVTDAVVLIEGDEARVLRNRQFG